MLTFITNKNNAFTIIELLIVITIIGILSSISINVFGNAQREARIAKGMSFHGTIDRNFGLSTVGKWHFNDLISDTIIDSSGTDQTGYVHGGAGNILLETDCDLGLGNCLYFTDGLGMLRSYNSPRQNFTDGAILAAWVKPSATNGTRMVIGKSWFNESQYTLEIVNGRLGFYTWRCSTGEASRTYIRTDESVIIENEWQHIAVSIDTVNNTDLKISFYHNGDLVQEIIGNDISICNTTSTSITAGIEIGASSLSSGTIRWNYEGYMDEPRHIITSYDSLAASTIIQNLYALKPPQN